MLDEGPSNEDIQRLDRDSAHCPQCGAEIWDAAEVCPECHAWVGGNALSRPPGRHRARRLAIILIVILLLVASLLLAL